MTSSLNMIRGRSNIVTLTNNSGGALVAGDVCVQDTTGDEYVTTTTSAASVLKVFVAADSIASGATGRFYESGYCPLVNVNASVTRGRFLFTHTVAKQAAENATYGAGAFGKILKSGTTPSAIIYSATAQTAGGAGGATISESAYASPPGSPAEGDLWMITDGLLHARYTGAAWSYYFGTQKVTKPVAANFSTWFNQGSATLDDYGQLVLYTPAAGTNLRGKVMSTPSTPYNIDTIFIPGVENVTWMGAGLCWSDGTKFVSVTVGNINGGNANPGLDLYKWNTATAPASGYTPDYSQTFTYPMRALPNVPVWLRLSDDGVNRTVYLSFDWGKHFQRYHQVGRTDHLTPTQIGICVYSDNANVDTLLSLLSWAQS